MWGGRLPAHYESVDAELHAILAYVRKMAREGEEAGESRRVLILSDCKAAIHTIQTAHDTGEARGMRHLKCGGATVEAIEHYRKKLGAMVLMWVPAHSGCAPNATSAGVSRCQHRVSTWS